MLAWATYTKNEHLHTLKAKQIYPLSPPNPHFIRWQVLLLTGSTNKQRNIVRALTEALEITQFNSKNSPLQNFSACEQLLQQWSQFTLTKSYSDFSHLTLNLLEKCISISGKYLNSQKLVIN